MIALRSFDYTQCTQVSKPHYHPPTVPDHSENSDAPKPPCAPVALPASLPEST